MARKQLNDEKSEIQEARRHLGEDAEEAISEAEEAEKEAIIKKRKADKVLAVAQQI